MSTIATSDRENAAPTAAVWARLPPEYAIPELLLRWRRREDYCRRLARSHYENFSVASWFLPSHLRQHFFNVYAYCRISDDLGDEVGDPAVSLQLLDEWEAELNACYDGCTAASGIRRAREDDPRVRDSAARICGSADGVPPGPDHRRAMRHSRMCWDTAGTRQIPWDIWCCICAGIAMPSGSSFPTTLAPRCNWRTSGRTSPWIIAKGGSILPLEDLAVWRDEETIRESESTPEFREMMRVRSRAGARLVRAGTAAGRESRQQLAIDIELFSRGGLAILDAIERQGYEVLGMRPSISKARKLWLVARAALLGPLMPGSGAPRTPGKMR